MSEIIPINDYVLLELEDEQKTNGLIYTTEKSKTLKGKIISFSKLCKNENFVKDKEVMIFSNYEKIPYDEEHRLYFVSEKAIISML